jgi:hypothetical protein
LVIPYTEIYVPRSNSDPRKKVNFEPSPLHMLQGSWSNWTQIVSFFFIELILITNWGRCRLFKNQIWIIFLYYYILKTIPIMIMRHICRVVIHVPRIVFYLSLRLRLLIHVPRILFSLRLQLRLLLLFCRVVILVPRFLLYLRLLLMLLLLLLCRVVILVPRFFFYLRLRLGLLLSPICSFFGNLSGIIVVPRLLCDISLLWMP